VRIARVEKLSRCPAAVSLGIDGLQELHHKGWTEESVTGLGYDRPALIAYDEVTAAGVIIYEVKEWMNSLCVELGYVAPVFRRQGVYRALWAELCLIAGEKGCRRISGSVHRDNAPMQSAMAALDREPIWLVYEYSLPADKEEEH
jgi:GNAT superfamily N-acetyltransferase